MFYVGKQKISPGLFSKGESSGDVITAKNYTGSGISAGDKVWINQKVYESGSSSQLTHYVYQILPDFDFYLGGNDIYKTVDNTSTGYSTMAYSYDRTINYLNGLSVFPCDMYGSQHVEYYKNGQILFRKDNAYQIVNRPDLLIINNMLKKINPETGVELSTFTNSDGSDFKIDGSYDTLSKFVAINDTTIKCGYSTWTIDETNMFISSSSGYNGPNNIVGVTSDKKYIISCSSSQMWKKNGNIYENVSSEFLDIVSVDLSNYTFYPTTNLLLPNYVYKSDSTPMFKYAPSTDSWDSVPFNISGQIQVNPEMTQYLRYNNGTFYLTNLETFTKNSLYPYSQINMSRDTLTGVAKENIANGEEGRVTTILP